MRFTSRSAVHHRVRTNHRAQSPSKAACALVALAIPALTQSAFAETPALKIELNKLEPLDTSCRAYVVVTNAGQTAYKAFKLDLVMFRTDGVIGKRFAIDLAPIKPEKRSVKLFTLEGTPCDQVGSLLINEVMECSTETGTADNCLSQVATSSLATVQLTK